MSTTITRPLDQFRQFCVRQSKKLLVGVNKAFHVDYFSGSKIEKGVPVERLGSDYGGWVVPEGMLDGDSICYCVGVGEDISFDQALIEKYGCTVFAFDPTPRAITYAKENNRFGDRFVFEPVGIWDKDENVRFYAPSNPEHVSHSALNLQSTEEYIEVPCRRLKSILLEKQHEGIDLLKLDVEGAEYEVLRSITEDQIDIGIVCVEFDEIGWPIDDKYRDRIRECLTKLYNRGFELIAVEGSNYTLVSSAYASSKSQRSA